MPSVPLLLHGPVEKFGPIRTQPVARISHPNNVVHRPGVRYIHSEVHVMPIRLLLQETAFASDEVAVLTEAFDAALRELGLVDRSDPAVELIAKRIIELASCGERDPGRLREAAIKGGI
jgi:hypothetical protein